MAAESPSLVVAVAGGSGSGKTTLTRALVAALGADRCAVLDHDSYYRCLGHLPAPARAAWNFDHPDSLESGLLAKHLELLRRGAPIAKPDYDFATHSRRPGATRVEPRPVIVCEGILLLAVPELRSAFDLRVFVDAPADVRALRRLQRDTVERGRTVESVVQQYLTSVRPMHERFVEPAKRSAHLVLDWRHSPQEWTRRVVEAVQQRRHAAASAAALDV